MGKATVCPGVGLASGKSESHFMDGYLRIDIIGNSQPQKKNPISGVSINARLLIDGK